MAATLLQTADSAQSLSGIYRPKWYRIITLRCPALVSSEIASLYGIAKCRWMEKWWL